MFLRDDFEITSFFENIEVHLFLIHFFRRRFETKLSFLVIFAKFSQFFVKNVFFCFNVEYFLEVSIYLVEHVGRKSQWPCGFPDYLPVFFVLSAVTLMSATSRKQAPKNCSMERYRCGRTAISE